MTNRFAMLSLLALFLYFPIYSQITYVSEDGTGDGSSWNQAAGDLRDVLQSAQSGDEIWVSSGTYRPDECSDCDRDDRDDSFEIPNQVQVYGGFVGTETQREQRDWITNETILSGDINQDNLPDSNAFTIVYFENVDSTTVIDGFTIRDGSANDELSGAEKPGRSGAGIYNDGSIDSDPTIRHCKFIDHFAESHGSAIYNNGRNGGSANPSIRDCSFFGNFSIRSGGAIYNDGGRPQGESSPEIDHCFFQNNTSIFGGAIYNNGFGGVSSPRIINSTFTENTGTSIAGAVYSFAKDSLGLVAPVFANCLFVDNFGKSSGAVYTLSSGGKARPLLFNCVFYENTANTGGAVYCNESDIGDMEVTMYNNIFVGNTATHNPIFHMSGSGTPIMNLYNSMVDVSDCESIVDLDDTDSLFCGGGIIYDQDPLFVDPSNFDFHLEPNSPAVDAGENQIVLDNDIFFDIDSLVRILNGQVDIGIFELNNTVYVPTNIITQPVSQNVCEDENIVFNIQTNGSDPLSYQWFKNGQPVPGAIEEDLSIDNVMIGDTGTYYLEIITEIGETLTSDIASLNALEVVTPALEILASNEEICANTPVNFTINTMEFEGDTPTFQWLRNDDEVGLNQPSYSTQSLSDGDRVRCVLTSSRSCVTTDLVFSNSIFMDVTAVVTPTINIIADETEICETEPVTFSADLTNEGANPQIEWLRNGAVINQNTNTITLSDLTSNDIIEAKVVSSELCAISQPVFSNEISVDITPMTSMDINISSNSQNICQGETITFTATSENGGLNPTYQWLINNQDTGETGSVFNSDDLNNNDQVSCQITSTEFCLEESVVLSNEIEITVNPLLQITADIMADQSEACAGELISFTSIISNGGASPIYEWLVNGVEMGQNMPTFSTDDLNDGDQVSCRIISTESCLEESVVLSNEIEITVNPLLQITADIMADQSETCAGELISFTSTVTNGGVSPIYEWLVNGVEIGQNMSTFSTDDLNDGDQVSCRIISNESCLVEDIITTNPIDLTINAQLQISVEITADQTEICAGEMTNFTAMIVNDGTNPTYQWMINGVEAGQNMSTFSTDDLNNGDEVSCQVTSTELCLTENTVTSTVVEINVNPNLSFFGEIAADQIEICEGELVNFTSTITNGGTNPTYQWMINGVEVGQDISTFSTNNLNDGDEVSLVTSSSESCLVTNTITTSGINILVEPILPLTVEISANVTTICQGESVTFTANSINAGSNPDYQWILNGVNVGNNADTYITTELTETDQVQCQITSSESCLSSNVVTSESLNINFTELVFPTVSIFTNTVEICENESATFTTQILDGGTSPSIQWFLNNMEVGTGEASLTLDQLTSNDIITVSVISSSNCASPDPVISENISIDVIELQQLSVIVTAEEETVCADEIVTFSATTENEGENPTYIWTVNGIEILDNDMPILEEIATENLEVTCTVISNGNCLIENTISSEAYSVTITQPINPMISIALVQDSICMDETLNFSAVINQEGSNPQIEWFVNGTTTGNSGEFFTVNNLAEGDKVTAVLSVTEECTTAPSITSDEINIDFSECNIVGVETIVDNKNISIFPNPAAEKFEINLTDFNGEMDINIYDLYGRSFFQKEIFINQNSFSVTVDCQSFPAGTYFIRLKGENTRNLTRVIVK